MAGWYFKNMSGASIPVYNVYDRTTIIDYIYHREFYVFFQQPNGYDMRGNVQFLGSDGVFKDGFAIVDPNKSGSQKYFGYTGTTIYRTTKSLEVYNPNGTYAFTLPEGRKVRMNAASTAGEYRSHTALIDGYWTTYNGYEIPFSGFIDTGIRSGSGEAYFGLHL